MDSMSRGNVYSTLHTSQPTPVSQLNALDKMAREKNGTANMVMDFKKMIKDYYLKCMFFDEDAGYEAGE